MNRPLSLPLKSQHSLVPSVGSRCDCSKLSGLPPGDRPEHGLGELQRLPFALGVASLRQRPMDLPCLLVEKGAHQTDYRLIFSPYYPQSTFDGC